MEEIKSPLNINSPIYQEPFKFRKETSIELEQRLLRQIEEQTQENLLKIHYYNSSIMKELKGLDTRIDSVLKKHQLDFYTNYQSWIKQKEQEFKEIIALYKEKQENKLVAEKKNKELTQMLWVEGERRIETIKQKEKVESNLQNHKRLIEALKDDIINYKQQAIEDKRRLKIIES